MPFGIQKAAITNRIRSVFGLRGKAIFQGDETVVPMVLIDDVSQQPWSGVETLRFQKTLIVNVDASANESYFALHVNKDQLATSLAAVPDKDPQIAVLDYLSIELSEIPTGGSISDTWTAFWGRAALTSIIDGTDPATQVIQFATPVETPSGWDPVVPYQPRVNILAYAAARGIRPFFAFDSIGAAMFYNFAGAFSGVVEGNPSARNLLQTPIVFGRNVVFFILFNTAGTGTSYKAQVNVGGRYIPGFADLR